MSNFLAPFFQLFMGKNLFSIFLHCSVRTRESDYGVMTNFRVEGVVYGRQVEGK